MDIQYKHPEKYSIRQSLPDAIYKLRMKKFINVQVQQQKAENHDNNYRCLLQSDPCRYPSESMYGSTRLK